MSLLWVIIETLRSDLTFQWPLQSNSEINASSWEEDSPDQSPLLSYGGNPLELIDSIASAALSHHRCHPASASPPTAGGGTCGWAEVDNKILLCVCLLCCVTMCCASLCNQFENLSSLSHRLVQHIQPPIFLSAVQNVLQRLFWWDFRKLSSSLTPSF